MYQHLRYALDGKIATITLDDAETLNALSLPMVDETTAALRRASGEARAIVLTGAGRAFSSGARLSTGPGPGISASLKEHYEPLFATIRDLPAPLIAAVNGVAAGIGCTLALAGDLIIASESASFVQAFARIGLVPDGGSTFLIPRMIGKARAMEMMLLGEAIPAAKAESWGLINRTVADDALIDTAFALARKLADGPASLTLIRKAIWASLDNVWQDQLAVEHDAQVAAGQTRDFYEGVLAFLQERKANFTGG
jgi:2-(1,2-epoxy-1,2-dihydrophenyl)acetyl-CoA isomerase